MCYSANVFKQIKIKLPIIQDKELSIISGININVEEIDFNYTLFKMLSMRNLASNCTY